MRRKSVKAKLFILLFLGNLLCAQTLFLENFESDLYSKKANFEIRKVKLDLRIEGRHVEDESFKIVDALNIVIGSFYAEDLLTSKGKSALKETLQTFSSKEYGIDIDTVYILSLKLVDTAATDEIVKALKEAGCCNP